MKTKPRHCPYCNGLARRPRLGVFECRICHKKFQLGDRVPTKPSEHHRYVAEFRELHRDPFEHMNLAMLVRR